MKTTDPKQVHDKSLWPDGPWKAEPDRGDWEEQGYACSIRRMPLSGHLCGYVGVPQGHPWFGADYNLLYDECSVHGALTFSGPLPDADPDLWWVGFDCAHMSDFSPGYNYEWNKGTYRGWDFVEGEVIEAEEPVGLVEAVFPV